MKLCSFIRTFFSVECSALLVRGGRRRVCWGGGGRGQGGNEGERAHVDGGRRFRIARGLGSSGGRGRGLRASSLGRERGEAAACRDRRHRTGKRRREMRHHAALILPRVSDPM